MLVGVLLKLDACAMARPSALPYLQQLYSIRPVSHCQSTTYHLFTISLLTHGMSRRWSHRQSVVMMRRVGVTVHHCHLDTGSSASPTLQTLRPSPFLCVVFQALRRATLQARSLHP